MPRIVSIFGGARLAPESLEYAEAVSLGRTLAQTGWVVATGGYIGAMEAASRGAHEAGGQVIGVTCDAIENWRGLKPNRWITEERRFVTLRERLYHLVECCDVAVALPGGIGTLSEIALAWSLVQTAEIQPKPILAVGRVWGATLSTFLEVGAPYVRAEDRALLQLVPTVADVPTLLTALS